MCTVSSLPIEIWIKILRWATLPSDGHPAPCYQPFRASAESLDESLRTKRAVVRVCRLWQSIATVFLYEDVRIGNDGGSLKAVLVDDAKNSDNEVHRGKSLGRYVRRLELPYSQTATERPGDTHDIIEILESCPCLTTLVRPFEPAPYSVRYEFPAELISLSSLTRLEWWHLTNAARSGGINSLAHVLRNAPSLLFLSVGGEFWINSGWQEESPLRLPALTTLRLRRANALFVWQICRWDLPSLVHVIADFPADQNGLGTLWLRFGPQLCTVEFGRNVAFYMTDQITPFIRSCIGVNIFNYFINFTAPPLLSALDKPSSLRCVGIHAFPCGMLHDSWRHLDNHFSFLCGPFLPALRHVVLYGDWQEMIRDQRFATLQDRLKPKGATILFADQLTGSPCEHL